MSKTSVRRTLRTAVLAAATLAAPLAAPAARADDAAARALTAAYNASAHDLFKTFLAEPGNIVFSPYSIGTAMAMALAGARGETEREMASALRQKLSRDAIDAANAGVLAVLNGYDRSRVPVTCPVPAMRFNGQECEAPVPASGRCAFGHARDGRCIAPGRAPASASLRTANALMLLKQRGDMIAPTYAKLLQDKYHAQVFRGAGLDEINGWVKRQTEGRIEKIIDAISESSPAVILNAVYFKAAWQTTFSARATSEADFHLTAASSVKVPMMHRVGHYRLLARPGFRAIRLPYSVEQLAMVVVLPNEIGGTEAIARSLDAPALEALFKALTDDAEVDLALPRFKTAFKAELSKAFKQVGLRRAFDANLADFSGMTGRPSAQVPLAIGEIFHRAVIDVTEAGTEAAAATAIAMVTASMPTHLEPFVVDRPFLFYITDETTGAILFEGRISDPRSQ